MASPENDLPLDNAVKVLTKDENDALSKNDVMKMVVSNWSKSYTPRRHMRKTLKPYQEQQLEEIPGASKKTGTVMHAALTSEIDSDDHVVDGNKDMRMRVRNHALIHYIAKLAGSNHDNDTFDFAFVQSLLKNGADINAADKYGQTVFHEVARSWHLDVAEFLLTNGANINQQDKYGRSPLHVSAAVDYVEMVDFLISKGAEINIRTFGEEQAPIHFAAKNDACKSLKALIAFGVDVNCRDYQDRTPLQLAAAMSRSKAARMLIEMGIPAGVYDKDGEMALSLLVIKMPDVANLALNQFFSEDNINHKRYFFLNYLEGTRVIDGRSSARTPLEAAVASCSVDIIMHPVIQYLISTKWERFGRRWAWFDFAINLLSSVIWTIMAVTLPNSNTTLYNPPHEKWWRMVLACFALLITFYELLKQVTITVRTKRTLTQWKTYRELSLSRDKPYCHPQWPDEARYVDGEIKNIQEHRWLAAHDVWVYVDWLVLFFIVASAISHAIFFSEGTDAAYFVHVRIMCVLLIVTWVRLMKYVRPFHGLGAFVASFSKMLGDISLTFFVIAIVFLPYASCFWIMYGGYSPRPAKGYESMSAILYQVFQMTVLDTNHDTEPFFDVDPSMARLLSCSYIFLSFVILLNLVIATITHTFKRVYSYAQEHAAMERAKTILNIEDSLRVKSRKLYWEYISNQCSPMILHSNNREDHTVLSEMVDINDRIQETHQLVESRFGKQFGEGSSSTMEDMLKFANEIVCNYNESKEMLVKVFAELRILENIVTPMIAEKAAAHKALQEYEGINSQTNITKDDESEFASVAGFDSALTRNTSHRSSFSVQSEPGDLKEKRNWKSVSKSLSRIARENLRKSRSKKTSNGLQEEEIYSDRSEIRYDSEVDHVKKLRKPRSRSAVNMSKSDSRERQHSRSSSSKDLTRRKNRTRDAYK